jgi:hypothetical protein
MSEEITNKVAQSALIVFDLEDYYPAGERVQIDLSQWLYEGIILKEKDFRESLKNHDWSKYRGVFVALYCKNEAIIPAWAFALVTSYLTPISKKVVLGTIEELNTALYQEILPKLNYQQYQHKSIILKGCSKKPVPQSAYVLAMQLLQPYAKSIMFGEACSAVPLFKAIKA